MKKLLILGAGIYQAPLIKKAKEMGLYTIAASYPGPYPGLALADKVYEVDTRDYEALFAIGKQEGIQGVCTTGTNVAVISLGYLCQHLHLTGISLAAAKIVTDKSAMKEAFRKGGVHTAPFFPVSSLSQAENAAKALGFPVMVKAVDSSGSRGISKVSSMEELAPAVRAAQAVTKKEYFLVEGFLSGHEIGVDGFLQNGKLSFLLPHDKFVLQAQHTSLPEGHCFPYQASEKLMDSIRQQMELAVKCTGLDNCSFNADVLICGEEAYLLEIGGRAGATCIPELISGCYGFDYYEAMIRLALGETFSLSLSTPAPHMAKLLFSPVDGRITQVDQKALEALAGTGASISLDYQPGDLVEAVKNGTDRIGQVISPCEKEEELDALMSQVRKAIKINEMSLDELWRN